jgi:hypothetical protein
MDRQVWLVLDEDLYETRNGDGYFPHFMKAFVERVAAVGFVRAKNVAPVDCREHPNAGPCFEEVSQPGQVGMAYHIIPTRVDGARVTWTHGFETTSGIPDDRRSIQDRILETMDE